MLGVSRPIAKRQRNSTTKDVEKSLARQLGRVWSQGVTNQRKAQQKIAARRLLESISQPKPTKDKPTRNPKDSFRMFSFVFFFSSHLGTGRMAAYRVGMMQLDEVLEETSYCFVPCRCHVTTYGTGIFHL